jgi:hypothetical protein
VIRVEALVKCGINSAVADCAKPRSVLPFTALGRSAFVDGLAARTFDRYIVCFYNPAWQA